MKLLSRFWGNGSAQLAENITKMRKVRETASLEELKQRYALICGLNAQLAFGKQEKFKPQITALRETVENYLVVHQRMEVLLQNLHSEDIDGLREQYEQLHLCLRQLPRDTQKQYYIHLVEIRDRLERGL